MNRQQEVRAKAEEIQKILLSGTQYDEYDAPVSQKKLLTNVLNSDSAARTLAKLIHPEANEQTLKGAAIELRQLAELEALKMAEDWAETLHDIERGQA